MRVLDDAAELVDLVDDAGVEGLVGDGGSRPNLRKLYQRRIAILIAHYVIAQLIEVQFYSFTRVQRLRGATEAADAFPELRPASPLQ